MIYPVTLHVGQRVICTDSKQFNIYGKVFYIVGFSDTPETSHFFRNETDPVCITISDTKYGLVLAKKYSFRFSLLDVQNEIHKNAGKHLLTLTIYPLDNLS